MFSILHDHRDQACPSLPYRTPTHTDCCLSFWGEWHQEDTVKFSPDGLFPLTESKDLTCQDLVFQALSCWLDFCLTSTILLMKREESLCHYGENTEKDFCCGLDLFPPEKKQYLISCDSSLPELNIGCPEKWHQNERRHFSHPHPHVKAVEFSFISPAPDFLWFHLWPLRARQVTHSSTSSLSFPVSSQSNLVGWFLHSSAFCW